MNEILEILRSEIRLIIKQEIKKYMKENKYEKPYDGVVICDENTIIPINATDVSIRIPALGQKFLVKNKTGETLKSGDCVIVYAKGGNINNSYIGLKF